jgi:hypothetical protein
MIQLKVRQKKTKTWILNKGKGVLIFLLLFPASFRPRFPHQACKKKKKTTTPVWIKQCTKDKHPGNRNRSTLHLTACLSGLVTSSLPNSFTQVARHQHSGLSGAVSGVNHSRSMEVGNGGGDGIVRHWRKGRVGFPHSESTSRLSALNHQSRYGHFQITLSQGSCHMVLSSIPFKGKINSNILKISKNS